MTKGDDYTDFIERWYFLRSKPAQGQAKNVADATKKNVQEVSQESIENAEKERKARQDQKNEGVIKENETRRRNQLGPGC